MLSCKELRAAGRQALSDNWGTAAAIMLVYMLICCVLGIPSQAADFLKLQPGVEPSLLTLLSSTTLVLSIIFLPMQWGISTMFLDLHRGGTISFDGLFEGFTGGRYTRILRTYLLMYIFILLWMLLLIVPGILKALSYALAPFILRDEPTLGTREVLAKSSAMMKGRRWHLFCLYLSFIGWGLLAILTCGIGVLWLTPYMQSAFAAFYEDARADFEAQQAAEAPQQATL